MLKFTQPAPDFILPNAEGKNVNLRQFRGKWVVLYFYPRDDTPGCTQEAKDFSAHSQDFKKLNTVILGISKDSVKSHCMFQERYALTIDLLSDEKSVVLENYGVWQNKKFMGREFLGIVRTTYLIDPQGLVAHVWEKVSVNGHVLAVLEKVKDFQRR